VAVVLACLTIDGAKSPRRQARPETRRADRAHYGRAEKRGKTYALAHSAAFVDASDSRKPVVLVLTDKALPAKALTTGSARSMERNMNAFTFSATVK
jgi:hypothetical protein